MRRTVCVVSTGGLLALACVQTTTPYTAPGVSVATDAGPPVLPCGDILVCLGACSATDTVCQKPCETEASDAGTQLLGALTDCIGLLCPSTVGAVCDVDDTACKDCIQYSQSPDGGCYGQIDACESDTSGGGSLRCSAILTCLNDCASGDTGCEANCASTDQTCQADCCADNCVFDGTSSAQQLLFTFEDCLGSACPFADGGVCASDTTECQDCMDTAVNTGGTCESSAGACEDVSGGTGTNPEGCNVLLGCLDNCASTNSACLNQCLAAASTAAQDLYQAALNCMTAACSDTVGGVCASDTTACSACITDAQESGGACYSSVSACQNN